MERESLFTTAEKLIEEIGKQYPNCAARLSAQMNAMNGLGCDSEVETKGSVIAETGKVLQAEVDNANGLVKNLDKLQDIFVSASSLKCGGP